MKTEAETGVMQPQAKERLEPPAAGGGGTGPSPRAFGGSAALQTPWLQAFGLQNCERIHLLFKATEFGVI